MLLHNLHQHRISNMTSLRHQLHQVIPSLLAGVTDTNKMAAFDAFYLAVTQRLSARIYEGTASSEEILLGEKVGAAVESIATCFSGIDEAEGSLILALKASVAGELGRSSRVDPNSEPAC
jgi:hypothetical protein